MDYSLQGSSVYEIFPEGVLELVAMPSPGDLPNPGIKPTSPASQADSLPLSHQGSPQHKYMKQLFLLWIKDN